MLKACLLALAILAAVAAAVAGEPPFIIGEWAGDCSSDYRIGYRIGPDGELVGYTANKGVRADFGKPTVRSEDAEFFTLDFNDGGPPIVWKKAGQTMRPWSQGEGGSMMKDGMREGSPTPTFQRCR